MLLRSNYISFFLLLILFSGCANENNKEINLVIEYEKQVNSRIEDYFNLNRIEFVNTLDSLKANNHNPGLYPFADDGHPTATGYEVIAKAIYSKINGR